jgi:predicted nucleic acid-binding protein
LFKFSEIKIISTQVLSEFTNVCYKKNLLESGISLYIKQLSENFNVCLIYKATILKAIQIKETYNYSYYDSLIIASALQANCQILYTEDMQHNQLIENSLTIINPFVRQI